MKRPSHVFAALIGSSLLAACVPAPEPASEKDGAQPSPKNQPAPPSEPAPQRPPAEARVQAAGERAYVSVDGVGLHVVDERGWRVLAEIRTPIRDMLLHEGRLLVLSAFGVQHVDPDGQTQMIAEITRDIHTKLGDPIALATADGSEFWVAGPLGVARHSNNSWEFPPIEAREPASVDLAIDRAGSPWLAYGSLFRYDGSSWQPLADASTTQPIALLDDPRSKAVIVHAGCQTDPRTCSVQRATSDTVVTRLELPIDECTEHDRIAVSPDGKKGALAGRCGLVRLDLDGPANPTRISIADGWPGQPVRSLALDAGGRTWAGTHNGLTLVAADGSLADYPIAQLGELAGPVGPILVEGAGPPPPTLGRVRNGGLVGVLVTLDGETKVPLPGVPLELCSRLPPGGELVPDPERSPCAGVEPTHKTTTDGEGRFELTGLPIDHYWFGAQIDGRWARGQPKALNMRAGMSGNVGKVTVAVPG